jgi:phosphatidylserine/phosphatidylglycerophosphate/cardiolipin synthase-like enzyme
MSRRRNQGSVGLLGILIGLVIIAVAGYMIYQNLQTQPTPPVETTAPADDDEKQVSDISREQPPTPQPGQATVQVGSGGSTKSDWYELYFTSPIYPDPKTYKGGPDEPLVKLMDKATKTLDVADYDFDLPDVSDAMVRAKQRGVVVRFVTDSDTINNTKNQEIQTALGKLKKANIPFIGDERGPIMHDKFTVVDKQWVSTGSMNYTIGDAYHLNNNLIIINSPELAANYTAEFEQMFVKKEFGPAKEKGALKPQLTIGGVKVENYFAPEDKPITHIVDTINLAKQSIYFMAFSFTQDDMGKAIEDKAKAGVKVQGVFETTGSDTPFSEYGKMKKAGLDVYTDGNPWVMHHKVVIIDEQIVIFGSFNFSDNANKSNDENLLIVYDPTMAKAFKGEYDRVLALAKNPPTKKKK